jgi:hypothetical protein
MADPRGIQARMQRPLRLAEAREEIVPHRDPIAEQLFAGFRIAEAMSSLERKVALAGRQDLDRDHFAPCRSQARGHVGRPRIEQIARAPPPSRLAPMRSHSARNCSSSGQRPSAGEPMQFEEHAIALPDR